VESILKCSDRYLLLTLHDPTEEGMALAGEVPSRSAILRAIKVAIFYPLCVPEVFPMWCDLIMACIIKSAGELPDTPGELKPIECSWLLNAVGIECSWY
jgi:hypothetical protein